MAKPVLLVTRKLPEAIEARAAQDYDALLNPQDAPWATDGAEIARRATEASAAGILGAAGDHFDSVCINALPPSTKIIATFSVGFDHIDIAAAKARDIVVTNTPEVLSFATAECAFTLMLMAARRAGEGERMVRAGKWKGWAPTQLLGVTLERKKLGILGFGWIGRELASIARGFRFRGGGFGRFGGFRGGFGRFGGGRFGRGFEFYGGYGGCYYPYYYGCYY